MKLTQLKLTGRNNGVMFIAFLLVMMFSHQVNAACSRDDVEFYLGKGFTPEQITSLCATLATPAGDMQQLEQQQGAIAEDEHAELLKRAITAHKIGISHGVLQYTLRFCIEYGEENLAGFTPKVCPDVKFTITLKVLEILQMGKRYYFYGQPEILVSA